LILRKITIVVATRRYILKLKCTKFAFGCGSAPDPAGGAYSAPTDTIAGFKGPTSMGKENGWTGGEGKGGVERRRGTPSKARGMGERGIVACWC